MLDQANMKFHVDLSLFTKDNSFGHINGDMLFPSTPRLGDVVSFAHPAGGAVAELMGIIRVRSFINLGEKILLMLSDICVENKNDAFNISHFLENNFGLFANIHDAEDLRVYMDREARRDS